ncbi:MAG: phosphatidate cytidylyltransferase [Gammaproteobacteria bacterium]|nr:phosphatidate cytidylyltransferase [Gammaproteobacteria bacterium]
MAISSLTQRVFTAVVLVALLLPALLFLPKGFGLALVSVFVLGAAWEWSAFVAAASPRRIAYVGAVAFVMAAVAWVVPARLSGTVVLVAALLWWSVAFAMVLRFPFKVGRPLAAVAGACVLVPAWFALLTLLDTPSGGRTLLLVVIAITCAADIGAYFAGRRFGRVKLAPQVSPGKTWEGVMGGLLLAVAVALASAAWLRMPPGPAVFLGLSVASLSIVGDLTASLFKRGAGLKDSGSIFPGHGGILDRIDSLTAAAPLFVLVAGWLGWLGAR